MIFFLFRRFTETHFFQATSRRPCFFRQIQIQKMCQHKNFAKSSYVETFFPNSGSDAASGFITSVAVVVRVAAAEPELEKICQHENFWQNDLTLSISESSCSKTCPRPLRAKAHNIPQFPFGSQRSCICFS